MEVDGCTGEVIPGSYYVIHLDDTNGLNAEPHGLEWSEDGQFLYFTHKSNLDLPGVFDVWDHNALAFVTSVNTPTGINAYRNSYIERYGDKLYLASGSNIMELDNVSTPVLLTDLTVATFSTSSYGNDVETGSTDFFRNIVQEQLDDEYPDLAELNCDCCNDYAAGRPTITILNGTNITWDANTFGTDELYFDGDIIVEANAELTIEDLDIFFSPESEVRLKRSTIQGESGGILRIENNSLLSSDQRCINPIPNVPACMIPGGEGSLNCADIPRWKGVRVEGDASFHKQTLTNTSPHGKLFMDENSEIELAEIGILAGHETLTGYGGGVLRIKNSKFTNNLVGVEFDEFIRYSTANPNPPTTELFNLSFIDASDFRTGSNWDQIIGNDHPEYFVFVKESSGLNLRGNTFNNDENDLTFTEMGTGIRGENSRLNITWDCDNTVIPCPQNDVLRTTFNDLYYGIHVLNSTSTDRPVDVFYGVFENNYHSIYLTGCFKPNVLDNDVSVRDQGSASGLYLFGSTKYTVEGNSFRTFNNIGDPPANFGIVVNASGTDYNEIYRNDFADLGYGILTISTNAQYPTYQQGLQFLCNDFDFSILKYDIFATNVIQAFQGSCPNDPAGNTFSHSSSLGNSVHGDFVSVNQPSGVRYYHHDLSSPSNVAPLVYSTNVQLFECTGNTLGKSDCPSQNSGTIGIQGLGKSLTDNSKDDIAIDHSYIEDMSDSYMELIESIEEEVGWGSIEEIISLINNDVSESEVITAIEELEIPVAIELIDALLTSENETLIELGINLKNSYDGIPNVYYELYDLRLEYDSFWVNTVSYYSSDTTGTISSDEMYGLLTDFQPHSVERFASSILESTDQEWIELSNQFQNNSGTDFPIPTIVNDSLPNDLTYFNELNYFQNQFYIAEINDLYIESHESYDPYIPDLADIEVELLENQDIDKSISQESYSAHILVSPNPFNEFITFTFLDEEINQANIRIVFFDILGRQVENVRLTAGGNKLVINGSDLPTGYLTYILYKNENEYDRGKLLKIRD